MGWVQTFCFSCSKEVPEKFFQFGGNSLSLDLFVFDTLLTQVNHQSGKEKKGSVLGRFLGRKKVNTWVDACLGPTLQLHFCPFSRKLSVGSDMQTTEDYYACPVTSNSIILTLWNPLLYKYSGRNTRWKWKTNIFEFDEILVAMNSLVSYAFNCKNKMGWQCWLFYRKSIYFYAVELLRCCWKYR